MEQEQCFNNTTKRPLFWEEGHLQQHDGKTLISLLSMMISHLHVVDSNLAHLLLSSARHDDAEAWKTFDTNTAGFMRATLMMYASLEEKIIPAECEEAVKQAWIAVNSFAAQRLAMLPCMEDATSSRMTFLRDHVTLLERTLAVMLHEIASSHAAMMERHALEHEFKTAKRPRTSV